MRPANERQRYNVALSLIGWAHSQNDPWTIYNAPQLSPNSIDWNSDRVYRSHGICIGQYSKQLIQWRVNDTLYKISENFFGRPADHQWRKFGWSGQYRVACWGYVLCTFDNICFCWCHIDGSVQDCSNSTANALELLQSCTKPSTHVYPWPGVGTCYVDATGGVPRFLSQGCIFWEKFLSQGYIFLPKSLAKGIFWRNPHKIGIWGLN